MNKLIIYTGISLYLFTGISLFLCGGSYRPPIMHQGKRSYSFPDKEYCSLICGVGWETFCKVSGSYSKFGWYSRVGDEIIWVIDRESSDSYRCDGLWFDGDGISGMEYLINGKIHKGKLLETFYRLEKDFYVVGGDIIKIRILSINESGFVKSIQPSGVH